MRIHLQRVIFRRFDEFPQENVHRQDLRVFQNFVHDL